MPVPLSIVSTLYGSAATVEEFVRRASSAAQLITDHYEIVLVDDGSPDRSLEIAKALLPSCPQLKLVELSRNFGHHAALMTGLEHASGDCCFLIDSDLEEAPELLGEFWRALNVSGVDVVYGFQEERRGDLVRRTLGRLAYFVFQLVLPIRIPLNHLTVRLMRRPYVDALLTHRERQTAIGGLWVMTGFHQLGTPVDKGVRSQTSYRFGHRLHTLINSITSFSAVPLVAIFYLGLFIAMASALAAVGLVARRMSGTVGDGWTSLMVSVWFIGGMLIFCVGVVGIYVSKIFIETKQRPYTIVRAIHANRAGTTE